MPPKCTTFLTVIFWTICLLPGCTPPTTSTTVAPENESTPATNNDSANDSNRVIVVGAGISGLAAALDLGRGGAKVTVVDMSSVFGGHAVMSQGAVSIVATPDQEKAGIKDSPDLAF